MFSPNVLEFYWISQKCVTHTFKFHESVNSKNADLLTMWAFYQFRVRRQEFHKQSRPVQQTYALQSIQRGTTSWVFPTILEPLIDKSNSGMAEPGIRGQPPPSPHIFGRSVNSMSTRGEGGGRLCPARY